jgi:hypothetical protein
VRLAVAQLRRLPPNIQGALWLVSGGFIFTSNSAMIRLLSTEIESVQTAFFRAFFSVLLLAPMILTGRVQPWKSERLQGHFWRTAMGTTSMVLGFYAVSMLPLADATALAFSQPLFSVVLAALVLREKVRWRRWSATIVGFIGVLVMVRPGSGSLQPGAAVALLNALASATSILLVRRLSDSEKPLMILTQFALFSTLLLVLPAIWFWKWPSAGLGAGDRRVDLGDHRPVLLGPGLRGRRDVGGGAVRLPAPAVRRVRRLDDLERDAGDLDLCRRDDRHRLGALHRLPRIPDPARAPRRRASQLATGCLLNSHARAFARWASVMWVLQAV